MSALEILPQHRKPLSSMTDKGLDQELEICSYELSCRNRWGDDTKVIEQDLAAIEDEIRRRRVASLRADTISTRPFVVDDPGTRPITLMGSGKMRSEWVPPRVALIGISAAFALLLAGAVAMAGQRVVDLDDRYKWEAV